MMDGPQGSIPRVRISNRIYVLPDRKKDLLLVILLAVAPVLFLSNVLFTDQVLVGENLARYYPWRSYANEEILQRASNQRIDPLYQYYPQRVVAAAIVRTGNLPLWNPYYLSGVPFVATEILGGFFYPPNIIYYLVDPLEAFGLSACLHLFLAGMFMYFYLRSIQLDSISSLFGSVTFQLSGYLLANLMWLSRVSTAVWAPLLFFCFEKYWKERRWGYAVLLAFGLGMSILAGTPAVVVFVMLGLTLYAALRFFLSLSERGLREAVKGVGVIAVAIGLGGLLAAVQLIPTYEATPFFERAQWSPEEASYKGTSPSSLATALLPDIFGNPVDTMWLAWGSERFGHNVPSNYARPNLYAGILPLLLALWALAFRRNIYVFFFAGLAILSLSLFLNLPSFFYRILYAIPVFRAGRPMEVKIIYAFALCVLTAWGFSSLAEGIREQIRPRMARASHILLAIGIASLVGAAITGFAWGTGDTSSFPLGWYLYNVPNLVRLAVLVLGCAVILMMRVRHKVGVHLWGFFAIALVVADMCSFGWKFNTPQRAGDLFFETDSIRFLRTDADLFRIIRGPDSTRVLPSNTPAVYGISDAQGYTSLMLDYYGDFINLVEPGVSRMRGIRPLKKVESFSSKLLDLLNVKYILTHAEVNDKLVEFDQAHEDIDLVYDGEIKIYQNRDVLPRAFVVHEVKILPDKAAIFADLTSEEFDPAAYIILEEEPLSNTRAIRPSAVDSIARILAYTPNKVIIEADAAGNGFLVLTDLYYGGWKAFVDGEEGTVYKADYIFRAVELPEGRHIVEFVFDPLSFKIGLWVSIIAFVTICSLLGYALLGGVWGHVGLI